MLAIRLPADIEKRLAALAQKTGRTKSFYVREAILRHVEDLEDYHLAQRRLVRGRERVTLEELEQELAEASGGGSARRRRAAAGDRSARKLRGAKGAPRR
jgi:RHH-type transcriptional regulator, rel operon repressor / antitoxin RelB